MRGFISAPLLAATALSSSLKARADTEYQVTDFSAYIAAHTSSQTVTFTVTPSSQDSVSCSTTISANIGGYPTLTTVTDGECASGSGITFNFSQGDDSSITLEVETEDGATASYTSPADSVAFWRTGPLLTDFGTKYFGPSSFNMTASQ